jgi:hypothetical protein
MPMDDRTHWSTYGITIADNIKIIKRQNDRCRYCNSHISLENSKLKIIKSEDEIKLDPLTLILKSWRLEKSKEKKVPAYVVCSDKTISALVGGKPTTANELLDIFGIGDAKLRQYGDEILSLISKFLKNPEKPSNEINPIEGEKIYCICDICTKEDRISVTLPRGQIHAIKTGNSSPSTEIRRALSKMMASGIPPEDPLPFKSEITGSPPDDFCGVCGQRLGQRCYRCGNCLPSRDLQ